MSSSKKSPALRLKQKVTPFIWFDKDAEKAAKFYVSVFKGAKISHMSRYTEGNHMPAGTVLTATVRIGDQELVLLNGGPIYTLTPGISLFVNCKTQREVDSVWAKLAKDGKELRCGWITDKFGVTWQIVPEGLHEAIQHPAALKAMFTMTKLDIHVLRKAAKSGIVVPVSKATKKATPRKK